MTQGLISCRFCTAQCERKKIKLPWQLMVPYRLFKLRKSKHARKHVSFLETFINQLETSADQLAKPFSSAVQIIESTPGISHLSALVIISETSDDMSNYKSAKISRAGVYIKPIIVQCALAAIKNKSSQHYRQRYKALKYRRGHKKAVITIARMMLTAIYTMLSNGELFNPKMYDESLRKPEYILSPEQQLRKLAKRLGYSVVKVPNTV